MKIPKVFLDQIGAMRRRESSDNKFEGKGGLPDDFDATAYLELNPDVASSGADAVEHYINFGSWEKRVYNYGQMPVEIIDLPDDFDESVYLRINKDVAAAGLSPAKHFVEYGWKEGRAYKAEAKPKSTAGYTADPSLSSITPLGSSPKSVTPRLIAFYLPQFHRVKENDEWWGKGFTEWTNVKKAKPNFVGHRQPHVPASRDYYDLSDPKVQYNQSKIAKEYGVTGFCYYMYWFDGRRILERPLDILIENPDIDIQFCVCWANENWTRTWDGKDQDILIGQTHSRESDRRFIKDAIKYLGDPRYIKVDGKPVLLVYRVDLLPECKSTAEIWRHEAREAGLGELHLCAIQFYGITDPTVFGFDAAVEFPPHGWLDQANQRSEPYAMVNKDFTGHIFDYKKSVDFALQKSHPAYPWYRCAFPGWDNTARRQNTSHIFADSNPFEFERWLTGLLRQAVIASEPDHQLVFINAWNEWAEGAHLEPDELGGFLNLQAVNSAITQVVKEAGVMNVLARLRTSSVYPERAQDEEILLNLFRGQERSLKVLSKLLVEATNSAGT